MLLRLYDSVQIFSNFHIKFDIGSLFWKLVVDFYSEWMNKQNLKRVTTELNLPQALS
jgi:hypothetical protein